MKKRRIKRKLKNWVKVFIISIISFILYLNTGSLGKLAQDNKFGQFICFTVWMWLFIGQFVFMYFIVENNTKKGR